MPEFSQSINEFLDDLWAELRHPRPDTSQQRSQRDDHDLPDHDTLQHTGAVSPPDGSSPAGDVPADSIPPADSPSAADHPALPTTSRPEAGSPCTGLFEHGASAVGNARARHPQPASPQPVSPQFGGPSLNGLSAAAGRPQPDSGNRLTQAARIRPKSPQEPEQKPFPPVPRTLSAVGISSDWMNRLILKLLASRGALQGRAIAAHIRLLFPLVESLLQDLRREQLVVLKGDAIAGDYTYVITERGLNLARQYSQECTYFGATPVTLKQYIEMMRQQTIAGVRVRSHDLQRAFSDLLIDPTLLKILGPAINSGRGLFLFGEPGNGKTSIAERVSRSFGKPIWIPRAVLIDGHVIRIYDPAIHQTVHPSGENSGDTADGEADQRWICVHRPTVIAGGELTMSELEVNEDPTSHICEAPLQLKSNGGVLLIDDFGRQRMPVDELLNRWIVPLEKRYDLLNLPSGKKVQVPFDQLVIFSTNLEPRDLVDDAFLRRIPYKVEVPNPTPEQFHQLFRIMCRQLEIEYRPQAVDYLIRTHYEHASRPLKACHPRDLLMQIRNYCIYEEVPVELTRDSIDFAVRCYFSVLS